MKLTKNIGNEEWKFYDKYGLLIIFERFYVKNKKNFGIKFFYQYHVILANAFINYFLFI